MSPPTPHAAPAAAAKPSGPKRLSKKEVKRIASAAKSKIMRCYFMHADVDGRETIKIQIRISPAGDVIAAKVKGKHARDQVGACVSNVVRSLKFPRSSGASTKHYVRYTVGG